MGYVVIKETGGYDKLNYINKELRLRDIKGGEVIVDVKAIGLNFADTLIRLGLYKSARDLKGYPLIPGFEFSGIIVESRSKKFRINDNVVGLTKFGGYNSRIIVSEDSIIKKPENLSFIEAAAIPVAFFTAHYALVSLGNINNKSKVLIKSGAGGVGSCATLLAKNLGAEIDVTVSNRDKFEYVLKNGATRVFTKKYLKKHKNSYDIILDPEGGDSVNESLRMLKKKGRLILYGFNNMIQTNERGEINILSRIKLIIKYITRPKIDTFKLVNENKSVFGFNMSYFFEDKEFVKTGMKILEKNINKLNTQEITLFSLSRVADAHKFIESRRSKGKIVLIP